MDRTHIQYEYAGVNEMTDGMPEAERGKQAGEMSGIIINDFAGNVNRAVLKIENDPKS